MLKRTIKKNNVGFTTVELVITIAVMSVITAFIVAHVFNNIESSKEVRALVNAEAIFDTAQYAIVSSMADTKESFFYALKYEETVDGNKMRLGRFSNQSLYKYLQESNGSESLSSAKSKPTDYYIAKCLANSIPGADSEITDTTLKNKSPIGDSHTVKYMSEHPETYGKVIFALSYNSVGQIISFQCVYDGYYIYNEGRTLAVRKVDDSKFNDWPSHRFQQSSEEGW